MAVGFLSASVGAINAVRPCRCKHLAAHLANAVLASFEPLLRHFLLISAIAAQTIQAILLGFDVRIKLSATPLADDLSDRVARNFAGHLFFIAFFQIRLIFVFPFAVPHDSFSFRRYSVNCFDARIVFLTVPGVVLQINVSRGGGIFDPYHVLPIKCNGF